MVFPNNDLLEFRKSLFHDLRDELGSLKTCQTSLLIFGSAGAGLFFGIIRGDFKLFNPAYLFLFPLIFLLPLWVIFYEKARTIARIVGFLRVQEKLYVLNSKYGFIGWESAMKKYWTRKNTWDNRKFDILFATINQNKKSLKSVYWATVYITFFSLNLVCLILSGVLISIPETGKIPIALLMLIFLILVVTNEKILNFSFWKSIRTLRGRPISEHTDLGKFLTESAIMSILFLIVYIGMLYLLGLINGATIPDILIYGIFLCLFLFTLTLVLWMFRNLVKARYSYDMFEMRWQIILNILIDEDGKTVENIDWEKWDPSQEKIPRNDKSVV